MHRGMHSCNSQVVAQLFVLKSQGKTDAYDRKHALQIFVDGADFYKVALKFHDSSAILEVCDTLVAAQLWFLCRKIRISLFS